MIADKPWPRLDRTDWNFMVVDRDDQHHYPPGYLFLGDKAPQASHEWLKT